MIDETTVSHPWNGWAAMVGENGLETMTRAHFDFVAYVHEHCDHEACTLNGRIELRYCPKCEPALPEGFAAAPVLAES